MGQPGPGSMDWWHSFTDCLTAAAAHGHMPSAALGVAVAPLNSFEEKEYKRSMILVSELDT